MTKENDKSGDLGAVNLRLRSFTPFGASWRAMLPVPLALMLAACASSVSRPSDPAPSAAPSREQELALQSIVALQSRLYRVAAPLLVNNAELCKDRARNLLGFIAKNRYSYSSEYVNAAQKSLRLGDRLHVMAVLPGSGAARVGILPGDVLLSVEDKPLPEGENAEGQAASILAPLLAGRSAAKMAVQRNGINVTTNVPLTFTCMYGIELGNTDNVSAYADGYRVLVSRGMMDFARSDAELAYVLSRELAHNLLSHPKLHGTGASAGGIIDNLTRIRPASNMASGAAGVKPLPPESDINADRLSMYMLARAGYRLDGIVPFWRKLAAQYPATALNGYAALHPVTNHRIVAMERTLKDIQAKQNANKPLLP